MSFSASWYKHEKMLLPEISADKKFFYAGATSNNVFHNLSDEKLKYLYDNYFKYVSTYCFPVILVFTLLTTSLTFMLI